MTTPVKISQFVTFCLFTVLIVPLAVNAAAESQKADTTLSPYFLITSETPEVDRLPLLLTSVEVDIAGVIADVTVTQVYKNEGPQTIEAIYVFPGSTRAAVYGMTMTIGDRTIFAKIQERKAARKTYEKAKQQGKTASLLEQQRPNVFQMNVANILPGDRIKVELKYTELLVPTEGIYEFVYPTVVGPRYSNQNASTASSSDKWVSNPYIESRREQGKPEEAPYLFDITTRLSTGIPIQEVSCSSHNVDLDYDGPASAEITLDEKIIIERIQRIRPERLEQIKIAVKDLYIGKDFANLPVFYKTLFHIGANSVLNASVAEAADEQVRTVKEFGGDRDYILRYRLAGGQIESGLLLYEGQDENFFLVMMQPPEQVVIEDIPPREYIFIVDVSGSMRGFPLDISKTLLTNLISELRPVDTFNVLLFAGTSSLLSERSLSASPKNIEQALHFIDTQRGGGGTEILSALKRALTLPETEGAARTIVIATDGYVHVETEAFDLIRNNLNNANMFAFGIGKSVNRFLIEGMARIGLGEPFVITDPGNAAGQAEQFRQYIQTPVLSGIEYATDGFEIYDVEPLKIPDVLAERPVVLFGKWKGEPRGAFTISGHSGRGEYRQRFHVGDVQPQKSHAALRYLWARKRIEILGDYNALQKDEDRVQNITQLGLQYNVLTAYTSFIAVDERIRRQDDHLKTVKQPLPLPKGVPTSAVGVRKAPEPELSFLVIIAGVLITFALRKIS